MSPQHAVTPHGGRVFLSNDASRPDKEAVRRLHKTWTTSQLHQHLISILLAGLWFAAPWAWYQGWWLATVAIWLAAAHLQHMKMLAMHEASHGLLSTSRRENEIMGMLIGAVALTPLSVYRFAHHYHHAHVGTEKDVELWPYNDVRVPRFARVFAAQCELFLGVIYTPLAFLRAVIVTGGFSSRHARRIYQEYALRTVGRSGFRRRLEHCFQTADYAIERLNLLGRSAWRHEHSVIVVFDRPSDEVVGKWQLAAEGDLAHIITMPHVTRERVDALVDDLKRENGGPGVSGER